MQVGELYAMTDEDGKKVYSYQSLGEELCIPSSTIGRLVNEYKELMNSPAPEPNDNATSRPNHKEIQRILLWLGQMRGLKLWLGNHERNSKFSTDELAEFPNLLSELPAQLYSSVRKVIEDIDVLWLDGERIVAAFEVEDTSPIYSGLLRMSDLRLLRETVLLHVVAQHNRRRKVVREIERPTFKKIKLREECQYIPYDVLTNAYREEKLHGALPNDWQNLLSKIAEDL